MRKSRIRIEELKMSIFVEITELEDHLKLVKKTDGSHTDLENATADLLIAHINVLVEQYIKRRKV